MTKLRFSLLLVMVFISSSTILNAQEIIPMVAQNNELPDLYIEEIQFRKSWNGKSNVFITKVCNRGVAEFDSTTMYTDYGSKNRKKSVSGGYYDLRPGQCIIGDSSVYVDSLSIYQSGRYYMQAKVDTTNAVQESDENNNYISQYIVVDLDQPKTGGWSLGGWFLFGE